MSIFYMLFLILLSLNPNLESSNSTKEFSKKISERDVIQKKIDAHKKHCATIQQKLDRLTSHSPESNQYREELIEVMSHTQNQLLPTLTEDLDILNQELDILNQKIQEAIKFPSKNTSRKTSQASTPRQNSNTINNHQSGSRQKPLAGIIRKRSSTLEDEHSNHSNPESRNNSNESYGIGEAGSENDDHYTNSEREMSEDYLAEDLAQDHKQKNFNPYDPTNTEISLPPPLPFDTYNSKTAAPAASSSDKKRKYENPAPNQEEIEESQKRAKQPAFKR